MRTCLAILAIAVTGLLVSGCGAPRENVPSTAATAGRSVAARSIDPSQAVGAIFVADQDIHTCTGSVVHSTTGNVILTAAHCLLAGYATTFIPKFADPNEQHDVWKVDAVYLDPRWVATQDPHADYAFATVSSTSGSSIEKSSGAGLSLGSTPKGKVAIHVIAYPAGDGGPIGCDTTLDLGPSDFPTLQCAGLVDGSSGAPLIAGSTVVGVIGGLDGGGCYDDVSYSSTFDGQTSALLARAESGGPGDSPPDTVTSTC